MKVSTESANLLRRRAGYGIRIEGRTLIKRSVFAQSDFARPRMQFGRWLVSHL